MLKIRLALLALGVALLLPSVGHAQSKNSVPAAPIPAQIAAAKKIFISNTGAGFVPDTAPNLPWRPHDFPEQTWSGTPDRIYNEFYAEMKKSGRLQLLSSPADADLIVELSLVNSSEAVKFQLVITDPKTHVVLWTLHEFMEPAMLQSSRDKNFEQGLQNISANFLALVAAPVTANQR